MMKVKENREGLTICHSMLCGEERKERGSKERLEVLACKEMRAPAMCVHVAQAQQGPPCNFLTMMDGAQRAIRTVNSDTFHTFSQKQPLQLISKCLSSSVVVAPSPLQQRRLPLLRPKLTWSRTCTTGIHHPAVHCHTYLAC
jgi:hypothetical protein